MSKIYLPNSTQLDTLNEKLGDIGDTLAGQQLVTKDSVVNALGYEPAEKGGVYELIEEITLTEDTTQIIRTQEPDGTEYNFVSMYLYYYTPETGGVSSDIGVTNNFYLSDGSTIYNYQPRQIVGISKGVSCEVCTVTPSGLCAINGEVMNTGYGLEANTPRRGDLVVTPGSTIKKLNATLSKKAPGEVITIYGVRA